MELNCIMYWMCGLLKKSNEIIHTKNSLSDNNYDKRATVIIDEYIDKYIDM